MFKGRHFDQSVILLCVRWYLAYNLSLRDLEEMMAERGLTVDHSTVHRWVVHFSPRLLERFNRRKRTVTGKWHVDETYIKVRGRWMYLYRAIDSVGDTVEFFLAAIETCRRPNASCAWRLRDMADPSASSSMAVRPIARRSFRAMPITGCKIAPGTVPGRSAFARANI
jgi:hypothetical protein